MATGVLNLCYLDSTCRAYDILSVQSKDWKYKTAVDIAAKGGNRKFISHPCCQKWLTNEFFGRISVRDINWGFFGVPLWLKVQRIFFLFLAASRKGAKIVSAACAASRRWSLALSLSVVSIYLCSEYKNGTQIVSVF